MAPIASPTTSLAWDNRRANVSRQTYADPDPDRNPPLMPDTLSSAETKLIYLYLRGTDEATVADMSDDLEIQRLSLFPVLDTLDDRGLVARTDDHYRAIPA